VWTLLYERRQRIPEVLGHGASLSRPIHPERSRRCPGELRIPWVVSPRFEPATNTGSPTRVLNLGGFLNGGTRSQRPRAPLARHESTACAASACDSSLVQLCAMFAMLAGRSAASLILKVLISAHCERADLLAL